jgi:CBS domain-containing protein
VAADAMVDTGLRSIPVVLRGGRPELVGMVSRGDVMRGFRLAMHDDK